MPLALFHQGSAHFLCVFAHPLPQHEHSKKSIACLMFRRNDGNSMAVEATTGGRSTRGGVAGTLLMPRREKPSRMPAPIARRETACPTIGKQLSQRWRSGTHGRATPIVARAAPARAVEGGASAQARPHLGAIAECRSKKEGRHERACREAITPRRRNCRSNFADSFLYWSQFGAGRLIGPRIAYLASPGVSSNIDETLRIASERVERVLRMVHVRSFR